MIIDQCKDKVPAELASHELLLFVQVPCGGPADNIAQLHHDNTHNKHIILSQEGGGGGGGGGWRGREKKQEQHS